MNRTDIGKSILDVVSSRFKNVVLEDSYSGDSFARRTYRMYIPDVDEWFEISLMDAMKHYSDREWILERLDDFCR